MELERLRRKKQRCRDCRERAVCLGVCSSPGWKEEKVKKR